VVAVERRRTREPGFPASIVIPARAGPAPRDGNSIPPLGPGGRRAARKQYRGLPRTFPGERRPGYPRRAGRARIAIPSYLLFAIGLLGAADILFFHTLGQRLHGHAPARAELVTHFLRGPTYALLFLAVPNVACQGAWFWALALLLAFDLAISVADFWLEPESRRALGGLPRGEYLLHVLIAMLFGALVFAVLREGASARHAPTALVWIEHGPPPALRLALAAMAPGVLWSGIRDLAAARRLGRAGA
jgi:hypothetical protein